MMSVPSPITSAVVPGMSYVYAIHDPRVTESNSDADTLSTMILSPSLRVNAVCCAVVTQVNGTCSVIGDGVDVRANVTLFTDTPDRELFGWNLKMIVLHGYGERIAPDVINRLGAALGRFHDERT